MVGRFAAHDLVRLVPLVASRWPDADPWVAQSLQRAPWAVVRRLSAQPAVAIGVRGKIRSQRFAASIDRADVCESVSPFQCSRGDFRNDRLAETFSSLSEFGLAWKLRIAPIGSYGFELASGMQTTHAASDLDVLVQAMDVPLKALRALAVRIDTLEIESGVRIDAELDYCAGGVALREVLAGRERVLFKTERGPKLLPCPV